MPSAGALAVAARRLGMSEEDIFDLALARSAWRSMVAVRLGAGHARLAWSKTPMPALTYQRSWGTRPPSGALIGSGS